MADRVAHEQPDVRAHVRATVQMNHAAGVVVVVQNHDGPGRLQELIGVVAVVALKRSGQCAARIQLDVPKVHGGIHVQQKIAALGVLFRFPREIPVGRIHDAGAALLAGLSSSQDSPASPEDAGIGPQAVAAIRDRQGILPAGIDRIFGRLGFQTDHSVARIHPLQVGLGLTTGRRNPHQQRGCDHFRTI